MFQADLASRASCQERALQLSSASISQRCRKSTLALSTLNCRRIVIPPKYCGLFNPAGMREGGLMSRNLSGRVSPVVMLSASSYERPARSKAAGWKAQTALVAILSLAVPQPGWAGSSPPNPPPPEPSAYVTNTGPLDNVGDGGCSQQYNPTILGRVDQQLIAQATQLAADVGGTTAKITAETATQVAASAKAAAAATKAAADADMAAGLAEAAVGVVGRSTPEPQLPASSRPVSARAPTQGQIPRSLRQRRQRPLPAARRSWR